MTPGHPHSPESARCASAKPNRLLESSVGSAWSSLLLDHHEGAGQSAAFETHRTDDLTLVVAATGRHQVDAFAGGRWRSAIYQAGSAGMTPPGETARLRWRTASELETFRTLHVYLPGSLLLEIADEYRRIGRPAETRALSALAFRDETIAAHVKALLSAYRGGEPDLYAAGAARWLVTHLLSHQAQWQHVVDDPRVAGVVTDRRLARVIEYMSTYLERAVTLNDLAHEAGISVHHFGRRFRESTGLGPAAYLATLRIAKARLLLRTTDLAVSDVGVQCGYPQASSFATAFQRHVGMSPTSYRMASRVARSRDSLSSDR